MKLPSRYTYPSPSFAPYWKTGRGVNLLHKLPNLPSEKAIQEAASQLWEKDILADKVVEELFTSVNFKDVKSILNQALSTGLNNPETVPASLRKLLAEVHQTPEWLNEELLEKGASFCRRSGALGLIVLRNYCLMGGYESSAINKPLIYTGALKKGASKRMAETVEFWIEVTDKNALQKSNQGFKSAITLRIMHALARVYIQKVPTWETNTWGIPLNQADMVATNLGFSLVFLEGLRAVGFRPSSEEVKGLFHFWKYIGFLIGIPAELLPDTEEQAIEALYKWTMTQPAADDDTKALAHSLMLVPLDTPFRFYWQRVLLMKINLGFNHFFLGKRACTTMGLPNTPLKYFPYFVKSIKRCQEAFIKRSQRYYAVSEAKERKEQVFIKDRFLEEIKRMERKSIGV